MLSKFLVFLNLLVAATALATPQQVKGGLDRQKSWQPQLSSGLYSLNPEDNSGTVSYQPGEEALVSTQNTRGLSGRLEVRLLCTLAIRGAETPSRSSR